MEKNLKSSQLRAIQYWFSDGLAEIGGGMMCLVLTIYFTALHILPTSQGGFAIHFLIVFIVAFGIRKLMFWYRERKTYPRTGFIEPKKGWEDRRMLGIAIGFTLLLLGFMLYTILQGLQTIFWMPILAGVILAFIFALAGYRTQLVRFYFLTGFNLILGIILSVSGIGDFLGAALLSLCTALVLFAFGIVTRIAYLHQSPVIVEQTNER
jgi:hypothetical protein